MFGEPDSLRFTPPYRKRRQPGTSSRNLRNRITCSYTAAERAAIEFLHYSPARPELQKFSALRGKPRRTIAKNLSAQQLAALVEIHAKSLAAADTTGNRPG